MSLRDQIQDEMKSALRAQDKPRLAAIRLLVAAIKQREIDERITLDDAQTIAVLERLAKQRRDSIRQYRDADRHDLADQEDYELGIIQSFLPEPIAEAKLETMITTAIRASGAESMRDMGKVMGLLKPQLQGRADMATVSAQVKARLSNPS